MATTMSSRAFNGDVARAKRAAAEGPVIITDRGRPAHVLLSWDEYARLTGQGASIADLLHHEGAAEIEFNPPRLEGGLRPADL
jgi:prevent-host-death family protein